MEHNLHSPHIKNNCVLRFTMLFYSKGETRIAVHLANSYQKKQLALGRAVASFFIYQKNAYSELYPYNTT